MKKFNRKFLSPLFVIVGTSMSMYAVAQMKVSHAAEPSQTGSLKEIAYQEIGRNGRLYAFASPTRKAEFEKSGELGKGIIKVGYGPNGETVVFDSEEALIEYASRLVKEILGKANIKAYSEVKVDRRVYVFTSPARKTNFEKSGELGVAIIKTGYGQDGETIIFDSEEALKEYDNRH